MKNVKVFGINMAFHGKFVEVGWIGTTWDKV